MARHALKQRPPHETLTLQESALASSMLHKIGDATVRFAIHNGIRVHNTERLDEDAYSRLVAEFSQDPKDSLAFARESLLAISKDDRLTEGQKSARLDRYLDAYTDLTVKLDHDAFPPSDGVRVGVPDYIPDGFVDMGSDSSTEVSARGREMVKVDKAAIFDRYKPLLKDIFSHDYEGHSSDEKKQQMISKLYWGVYGEINYNKGRADQMKGIVNLGDISEGVCRHIALTFQVLAQATGLTSRLLKCDTAIEDESGRVQGGRHAANMVRVNYKWYIVDPTNPDYVKKNGGLEGRLGIMPIDNPPRNGEVRTYEHVMRHSRKPRKYVSHNDAYWFIDQR